MVYRRGIPETVVEKQVPELYISGCAVAVPPGVFLQASKAAENAMIAAVTGYAGNAGGKAADLFCGLGTFTYPLAKNRAEEIISADSAPAALKGLQNALNRNQIHNVRIISRNLFKSPFEAEDLDGVKVVVMDPPRAEPTSSAVQLPHCRSVGVRKKSFLFPAILKLLFMMRKC